MKCDRTTLVVGASLNPDRYSNRAVLSLRQNAIQTFAFGLRSGVIADVRVEEQIPAGEDIHTVTMYVGKARQPQYYQAIINLKPSRVIFNPGAENLEFATMLTKVGIEPVEACTLVMLSVGTY